MAARVKFVSSRITAEVGPKPFEDFRRRFEEEMGVEKVGVKQDGRAVIQPPDWAMYPYDASKLVEEALDAVDGRSARRCSRRSTTAPRSSAPTATSAAYNAEYHEGVSPAGLYFARFDGFVFEAVEDDPLSGLLPPVDQLG